MSMELSALKFLEDSALVKADVLLKHALDFKAVALPKDFEIKSLEQFQKFKNRFTGEFSTSHIDSFAQYVNERDPAPCFISSKTPVALCIFDMGTVYEPGHCKHYARLELEMTAAYVALLSATDRTQTQESMVSFLEDWMHCIKAQDTEYADMDIRRAISAVRNVTVDVVKKAESGVNQLSTNKTAMERITAKSGSDNLPAWLYFTCMPYHGLPAVEFKVRISMHLGNEIKFGLGIVGLEHEREKMLLNFQKILQGKLKDKDGVLIGNFTVK